MKKERTVLPPAFSGGSALTSSFISVANAAKQVFGDATYDSDKLTRDISAVYYAGERYCERAIFSQTWKLYLDDFPTVGSRINPYGSIYLPMGKCIAVSEIAYTDEDGNGQTLTVGDDYTLDTGGDQYGVISPVSSGWPSVSDYVRNSVIVTFDVGYGTSLPDDKNDFLDACLLALGDLYEARQERTPIQLFNSGIYDQLIGKYKIYFDFDLYNES